MPLWPVQLPVWRGENIRQVDPLELLVELDEPLTFTFRDSNGALLLAHLCSQGDDRLRYVVAPTNSRIVEQLKSGARSIIAALDQPMIWLVDVGASAKATEIWAGTLYDLPPRVLPASDVMLYAHLTPMLRLRAMGRLIEPGSLPARVVRSLVGGAENAVRWLTNYVTDRDEPGRPPEGHRSLYQLQAQQFAFRSFEVAFRPVDPSSGQLIQDNRAREVIREVERLLSLGLNWVQTGELASQNQQERQAIFEAVKELSPTQGSPIESVEVGGRVAPSVAEERPRLTKTTRRLAGEAAGNIRTGRAVPDYVVRAGRIGAVDVDARTATVRNRSDEDVTFRFEIEFLDDVLDALNTQSNVSTVGARISGNLWLVAIERLSDSLHPNSIH